MLRKIDHWFGFSTEPAVVLAQYRELMRQIPLMYGLLIVNSLAVSYTHYLYAPSWLVVYIPAVLTVASVWRILKWTFSGKPALSNAATAAFRLRTATMFSIPICIGFITWVLTIDQYGGIAERSHVAIFVAVTTIGCISCLVHLPQAAFNVMLFVISPYLVYSFINGNYVSVAIALNTALVTGTIIKISLNSHAAFVGLIRTRQTLAAEQSTTERLGELHARLAITDALTGLPNRRYFFQRLEELLSAGRMTGERFVVGVFDLDRFKAVNDSFGHLFGDRLLCEVGKRVAARASPSLAIARLGGDEFGILIVGEVDRARELGQELCDLVARPFEIDGISIKLGCSGGLALFPDAGTSAHELFDRSDYALYHVKSAQRGTCALFTLEHETRIRSARTMESALQGADLDAELHVHFQPIVCTETMTVLGVEALGRWTNPIVGVVAPDDFIIIA
ncbi:MAG: diguanylate cyclase domain-containing protein, partial [Janthinobacterium lividum]